MERRPFGEDYMVDAYMGCVMHAIGEPAMLDAFQAATGIDMRTLAHRDFLSQAIDKATGYERFCILKFFDWVTVNVWGQEETGGGIESEVNA